MAIGRTEDRDTPWDPVMLQHRKSVRDPIRATHLGQRSIRSHTQAGHMTAIDQTRPSCKNPCNPAAVHTWIPAFAGNAIWGSREADGSRSCRLGFRRLVFALAQHV